LEFIKIYGGEIELIGIIDNIIKEVDDILHFKN